MGTGTPDEGSAQRLDQRYEEAKQLLSYGANQLRATTERYRELYQSALTAWHQLRDELEGLPENAPNESPDGRRRIALQRDIDMRVAELGHRQSELARLELGVKHLERAWLFLNSGDATLVNEEGGNELPTDLQMRIVEAQEVERQRLAQEVHDGPAQALTNAIFHTEYIERLATRDMPAARLELRHLREVLRRELADVRTFITQLRPPLLDEIGLHGVIRDHASQLADATGAAVTTDLTAPPERLGDMQQTVILRIVQEALQNIRKHANARHVWIRTYVDPEPAGDWILEIRDDGRGFDPAQTGPGGTGRSFGLRFMHERAELIGAQLHVESAPVAGTTICVRITGGTETR